VVRLNGKKPVDADTSNRLHKSAHFGKRRSSAGSTNYRILQGSHPGPSLIVLGAAALGGEFIDVLDMLCLRDGPSGRRAVNAPLLAEIVARSHATGAFVEYVGARPGEGPTGAFSFGRSRGVVEGVMAALGVPVAFLTPPSWKRLIEIAPGKDEAKTRARSEAIHRWPAKAALFARVKDDGRAEAALIAIPGLKRDGGPNNALPL
jgi:crossover junction endodeoxyribonuclease RuvC